MLFTFHYIEHDIKKLQEYLDFLFKDVWINAKGDFNFDRLKGNKELYEICLQLELEDSQWGNFFNDRIARIYTEFVKVDDDFKELLLKAYDNNNNIEGLCTEY